MIKNIFDEIVTKDEIINNCWSVLYEYGDNTDYEKKTLYEVVVDMCGIDWSEEDESYIVGEIFDEVSENWKK